MFDDKETAECLKRQCWNSKEVKGAIPSRWVRRNASHFALG